MLTPSRKTTWASDVRPSLPVAPKSKPIIKMGGFAFTEWGLAHDLSPQDVEQLGTPSFSPPAGMTNG